MRGAWQLEEDAAPGLRSRPYEGLKAVLPHSPDLKIMIILSLKSQPCEGLKAALQHSPDVMITMLSKNMI